MSHKVNFRVVRHFNAGRAPGGVVVTEDLAFAFPIQCAAVELHVGKEEVWLTRDEAAEVAHALLDAARDG